MIRERARVAPGPMTAPAELPRRTSPRVLAGHGVLGLAAGVSLPLPDEVV